MKKGNQKIIRGMIISAMVSLLHSPKTHAFSIHSSDKDTDNDSLKKVNRKVVKNILKINGDGRTSLIVQHSSHSSHASHSSHYSSSGNVSSTSQNYSAQSVYSAGGTVRGDKNKQSFVPVSSRRDASRYKLGDRSLSINMYGKDVDELAAILVKIKILNKDQLTKKYGFTVYDRKIVTVIKRFQIKHKLRSTGIVDDNTLSILRKEINEKK